jgi:hypothetical protein
MHNCLEARIIGGSVELVRLSQYECRGDNAFNILSQLVSRKPEVFEGKRVLISYDDAPTNSAAGGDFDLVFCSTKHRDRDPEFLAIPCPYSLGWPQVGVPDGEAMLHELLAIESEPCNPRMFWIGADTHPSRRKLCELAGQYPDVLEAELMSWQKQDDKIELRSRARYVSLPDHAAYKYLVDCPGVGYSSRLRWLLATGRPVFVLDRLFMEHWHDDMVPWVHYVPVQEDLSDLIQAYGEIETRPSLYEKISCNARQFVRENLLLDRQLDRMMTQVEQLLATT